MTALHLGPRGPIGPLANGGFEVSYVPDDGAEHRVPITQAAWAVPLEHGNPVRRFTSRKRQRHLSGLWWSATTGGHVGFESWLERDHDRIVDDPHHRELLTGFGLAHDHRPPPMQIDPDELPAVILVHRGLP